jgi:ribosomal protein S8
MKDVWRNYAARKGLVQKGYIEEYQNRNSARKTPEASRSDSAECCREIKQEEEIKRVRMKDSEKKKVIKHINKDDKEFRAQIKDDQKLKKSLKSPKKK